MRTAMRVHFLHRYVLDTAVILQEVNPPRPRCSRYNMQAPQRRLDGRHPGTAQCLKESEQKRRRLAEAKTREN